MYTIRAPETLASEQILFWNVNRKRDTNTLTR